LIKQEADNFSSGYNYIAQLLFPVYTERLGGNELEDLVSSLREKELSGIQEVLNSDLAGMIDSGFLGLQEVLLVLPPSAFIPSALVFAASDGDKVYNWEVPEYLVSALEAGESYIWMEDGIPELDLEGEYLITLGQVESPFNPGIFFAYVGIKPMHEKVTAINSFFEEEKKAADLLLAVMLGVSILVILLIIFLLLDYLIRKRITRPIEELSSAAEKVMRGDLDVEVEMRKGEEFSVLKYAFMDMVKSFRRFIAMSVGEEPDPEGNGDNRAQEAAPVKAGKRRPSLVFQITVMLVVVMIAYGTVAFFLVRNSQQHLIEESFDYLVQAEADNFMSILDYATRLALPAYLEAFQEADIQELAADLTERRISDLQRAVNADIQAMIDTGFPGLEMVLMVAPPSPFIPEALVWACNEENLIYDWEVPEYIINAILFEKD